MEQHLVAASRLLSGRVALAAADYRDILDRAMPEDVVYLDPPYQGVCGYRDPRYIQGLAFEPFVETLDALNRRGIAYILSYDGRTGGKRFGQPLPGRLNLTHIEIDAGRSSQATLLGRTSRTIESLYLSEALLSRIDLRRAMLPTQAASPAAQTIV
jgi:DNA adenine methylase